MTKILIIRFSSIGDIVLTTPVIRCLKEQIPDIELHYITKKKYLSLLESNPNIDKLYCINKSIYEISKILKKENYDFILDLHKNLRSAQLKLSLLKPFCSFDKLNFKKWLLVNLKINLLPRIHIVDRYLATANKFKIINDNKGLDYFISDAEKIDLNQLPLSHRNEYIAIVIGSIHQTKQFPADKIIALCKKIDKPVILLGDTKDREKGEIIKKSFTNKVFNACGLFSINGSASLVQQAIAVVSNDTGLMHIAAAFRKPLVSLWGNTVTDFGMYPCYPSEENYKSLILEVKGLRCRPCSKLGFKECPKKHFNCMNNIDIDEIANFVNSF